MGGAALWALNKSGSKTPTQEMTQGVRNFLNYLASRDVQEKWHKETGYVPVSKSILVGLEEFHRANPLHAAVVQQTIQAKLGKNSVGVKKIGYNEVRKKLYPLIQELITQTGDNKVVKEISKED